METIQVVKNKLFIPGIILLASLLAYFNGIDGEFVFDDIPLVSTDAFYSNCDTSTLDCWKRCYWRKGMEIGQYRPITLCSFLWNARLTGLHSPSFRIVNMLLHALIALLVLKMASNIGLNRKTAVFAALLFAVHPLHSEAVIPATGRAELLCALFVMLGLLAHAKYSLFSRAGACDAETSKNCPFCSILTKLAAPLFFILACWSKENGAVLLPLCLLYDICFRTNIDDWKTVFNKNRPSPIPLLAILRNYAGFAVALAIVAGTRVIGTGSLVPKVAGRGIFIDNPICDASFFVRILTAFHVQGLALLKFIWPATLSHDYSFAQITPISSLTDPLAILAMIILIALPFIVVRMVSPAKRPIAVFLWLAYLISILPAANFIVPTGTIFGERLCYLPSVWLCFIVTLTAFCFLERLERRFTSNRFFIPEILISFAILAAIFRTSVRTEDWKNTQTLAVSAVAASPLSVKSWNNLAVEFAHEERFEEAIAACDRATAIKPDYQRAIKNKIYYLIALKKYDKAEKELAKVLKNGSDDPDMFNKMAGLLARKGRLKKAVKLLKHSLSINPDQKQIIKSLEKMIKQLEFSQ